MTHPSAERFVLDFRQAAPMLPGAGRRGLDALRREALERFAQTGIPTRRDEEWKYTSLTALENAPVTAGGRHQAGPFRAADVDRLAFDGLDSHVIVFVNGRYAPALSRVGTLPAGAKLASLGDALDASPDEIEPFLAPAPNATVFAQLNTAFMSDGLYLHLARGTVIDRPIHLLFVATSPGLAIHPRNLVVAAAGARATIIEHYVGDDTLYFTNALTQISAADDASIVHYKLQEEGAQGLHIGAIHVAQARASRFTSLSIALGAALARTDITTSFDAEGCEATLDGLYVVGGRQHVDHHTRIDHAQPHGTSREHYRGVLDGSARGVFNGKVIVHPGAQKTDARQTNHNLLLSKAAEVDTKPQLEIYADDVKCSHGATVGQLDANQLFYLRSRGVDEAIARSLLTHAFAREVIERIRLEPVRARLARLLFGRLPQGDLIRELT